MVGDPNALFKALKRRTENLVEQGKTERSHGVIVDDPNADLEIMQKLKEQHQIQRQHQAVKLGEEVPLKTTVRSDGVSRVAGRLLSENHRQRRKELDESQDFDSDNDIQQNEGDFDEIPRRPRRNLAPRRKRSQKMLYSEDSSFSDDVAEEFIHHVREMHGPAALKLASRNLEGILDDLDLFHPEVEEGLKKLPKDSLIDFIQTLLGTLR